MMMNWCQDENDAKILQTLNENEQQISILQTDLEYLRTENQKIKNEIKHLKLNREAESIFGESVNATMSKSSKSTSVSSSSACSRESSSESSSESEALSNLELDDHHLNTLREVTGLREELADLRKFIYEEIDVIKKAQNSCNTILQDTEVGEFQRK